MPFRDLEDGKLSEKQYKQARNNAQIEISKRIPADIIWLFSYGRDVSGYFVIQGELNKTFKQREAQHHDLTKSLLNSRIASLQAEQRYNNILDLNPVFNIDTYRYMPH